MLVIPAVDIKGGRCVRLFQGLADNAALRKEGDELKKHLDWAARIIDSGITASQMRYDPKLWFKKYHNLKELENE